MTREETSKYTDPMADGTARLFSFLMDARSLITYPGLSGDAARRGWVEINGIAWTGSGKIQRVDVSTDGGATWTPAKLQEPVLLEGAHAVPASVELDRRRGGDHEPRRRRDRLRAADARPTLIASRGVSSVGYHSNPITGWHGSTPMAAVMFAGVVDMRRRALFGVALIVSAVLRITGRRSHRRAVAPGTDRRRSQTAKEPAPLRHRPARHAGRDRRARHRRRCPMAQGCRPDAARRPRARRSTRRAAPAATARPARKGRTTCWSAACRATRFRSRNDPRAPKTIGSYWPYATTVFDYIRRAMPPDMPGLAERRRGLRPGRVPAGAERADSGGRGRRRRIAAEGEDAGARPFRARRARPCEVTCWGGPFQGCLFMSRSA